MTILLTVLHVLFCIFLILVILLQTGKGSGMGAAFGGGGSSTVFGPRGAGSFIGKLTGVVAALFMISSISLAWMSSSKSTGIRKLALEQESRTSEDVDIKSLTQKTSEEAEPSTSPEVALEVKKEDAGAAKSIAEGADAGVVKTEKQTDTVAPVEEATKPTEAEPEAKTTDAPAADEKKPATADAPAEKKVEEPTKAAASDAPAPSPEN